MIHYPSKHVLLWTIVLTCISLHFGLFVIFETKQQRAPVVLEMDFLARQQKIEHVSNAAPNLLRVQSFDIDSRLSPKSETELAMGHISNNLRSERHDHATTSNFGSAIRPDSLPGAFANNTLYLQGIRLTTSHETSVDDLHVDLFGFPGDLTRVDKVENKWMACRNVTNNFNETLWTHDDINKNVTLFCELDSKIHGQYQSPGLIKMLFMPILSLDVNQNLASPFLWRCNVTEILNKPNLLALIERHSLDDKNKEASLPVRIWMQYRDDIATQVAVFRIPLDVGTLGVGSAHIQGGLPKSYFHRRPITTGLCLAVHGRKPLRYLSQFVQHHLNVGFHSIVIGVLGSPDNGDIKMAQRLLKRYIDKGVVMLAHYSAPFELQPSPTKLHFYLPCLYHFKGIAKYVATWDVDEFWLPPDMLDLTGRHNRHHFKLRGELIQPDQNRTAKLGPQMTLSSWSTFASFVRDDPLWQDSPYAQSVSIADTMDAIDRYYVQHGCTLSFCYHAFSSRIVFVRDWWKRTTRIGQDFLLRQSGYSDQWLKSVVNSKHAHSLGFHHGGSCALARFINASLPLPFREQQFHPLSHDALCYPRRFEHEIYGSIHHFFELLAMRNPSAADNITQRDEYGALFASTVERQLERDDPQTFNSSVL